MHACVALGRCVAFGRPKMSVWGHAGARSAPAKVACNPAFAHLLGKILGVLGGGTIFGFLFQTHHATIIRISCRLSVRLRRSRSNKSTEYSRSRGLLNYRISQ